MPEIYNVTNWTNQFWFHTGGTRAKKYLLNPDNNKYYYFKVSQYKQSKDGKSEKDYKYEFWSEIIAYELGTMLGFDILKYDIAIHGTAIGCISESMINNETEELVEGIKFLQAYDTTFNQNERSNRSQYTFQLVKKSLDSLTHEDFVPRIIETIVFDAIIGNGDRHQENWAIISKVSKTTKALVRLENEGVSTILSRFERWLTYAFIWDREKNRLKPLFSMMKIIIDTQKRFAPIYDSGSSLGRELSDKRVDELLTNEDSLTKYILKGQSEIHWNERKLSHFDLIIALSGLYNQQLREIIDRSIARFDLRKFEIILDEIDNEVPEKFNEHKIPKQRKALILKLVTSRLEMLNTIRQKI